MLSIGSIISSCDKGFDELNTNKIEPTSIDPEFIMNAAILAAEPPSGTSGILCYHLAIIQQMVTPFGSSLAGGNYNIFIPGSAATTWNTLYPGTIKHTIDAIEKAKTDDRRTNVYNQARIWKAFAFMVLTDNYGDIPYFDAGRGFLDGEFSPKYDTQESIYMDILKELEEASSALDHTAPTYIIDIMYAGNIDQWKRLGYSLLLRAAMRLTKVAPDIAETYVKKAVAGGLMQSNSDNAKIQHSILYKNTIANLLAAREKANYYLAEPFVNFLKDNNDPRLAAISIRAPEAKNPTYLVAKYQTTDPSLQVGMPMGYDDVSIASIFPTYGVTSLYAFSQANLNTVLQLTSPTYFVTYAQTQLLYAEAVVRGWAEGDAEELFASGIRAHMNQMSDFNFTINDSDIQTYLDANPLDVANALEQINTQYWVASFLNGWEGYANFLRSGYPSLTKNPYPGSEISGDFIRRMPYIDREFIVNKAAVTEAVERQGGIVDMNTRVWWDKE